MYAAAALEAVGPLFLSIAFTAQAAGWLPDREPRFSHTSALYASMAAVFLLMAAQKAVKAGLLPGGPTLARELAWAGVVNVGVAVPVFAVLEWRAQRAIKRTKRDS